MPMKNSYYDDVARKLHYEEHPALTVPGVAAYQGFEDIVRALSARIDRAGKTVVVLDYYHGVNEALIKREIIDRLGADVLIDTERAHYPEQVIQEKFGEYITDDRIMGVYFWDTVERFFDLALVQQLNSEIDAAEGLVVVYGVCAGAVRKSCDLHVYFIIDLQTIKNRYAHGMPNWGAENGEEEQLRKEKRLMFFEGYAQDRYKREPLSKADYIVDANRDDDFTMLDRAGYDTVMSFAAANPIKLVTLVWPGIWGGDWQQKVLGLARDEVNSAWGLNGNFDFQSYACKVGDALFEMPANDLIYVDPKGVIGDRLWQLYGYRCPFHCNYLDTYGGQNLSLQVHPTLWYAQEVCNSRWGHYESYYFMDAKDDGSVYLGTKTDVKRDELVAAFEEAQETGTFDDGRYINHLPMKRHDHIFIPAGTIHSAGVNSCVLEIDMLTFITFKLWDWGRVDLDGKPRPINIDHGKHVIQEDYQTEFVKDELVARYPEVDRGDGWRKENAGMTSLEAPLDVDRYWFSKPIHLDTRGGIELVVLVDGEQAVIESETEAFDPMVLNYGESVFIPASIGQYRVRPYGMSEGEEIGMLQIYMRR